MNEALLKPFKSLVENNPLPALHELHRAAENNLEFKNNLRWYLQTAPIPEAQLNESNKNLVTTHFRRIQTAFPGVQIICSELESLTGFKISCNAFYSNPNTQALPPHEDLDDSLIFQSAGKKYWKVWKPYHNEHSISNLAQRSNRKNLEEWMKVSVPHQFTMEKNQVHLLKAGHPHIAWTEDESSLHYTFLVFKSEVSTEIPEY